MRSRTQENKTEKASAFDAIVDAIAERAADRLLDKIEHDRGPAIKPRLLDVSQAAVYLGRSKDAVHHMIASGNLPCVRDGRRTLLDVLELDHWIEAKTERR